MKPRTEQLLYHLLFFAEQLSRPSYRNVGNSFESWAYRNGLLRRIQELERLEYIERNRSRATARIYRLTEKGRLHALGGHDPELRWNRRWDGKWRVLLFDLPRRDSTARKRLHHALKLEGFGVLQGSVWICPDPLSPALTSLCGGGDDLKTLISLEGLPGAGETKARIVRQAWDFDLIRDRYQAQRELLQALPTAPVRTEAQAQRLLEWGEKERAAWQRLMALDPLLPRVLHPPRYPGPSVWKQRTATLAHAGRLVAEWSP